MTNVSYCDMTAQNMEFLWGLQIYAMSNTLERRFVTGCFATLNAGNFTSQSFASLGAWVADRNTCRYEKAHYLPTAHTLSIFSRIRPDAPTFPSTHGHGP